MDVPEGGSTSSGMSQGRSRIELPADVPAEFQVYVNGVRQHPGTDYDVLGRTLVFSRSLAHEGPLGKLRWASMFLGVAGTYRRHDSVDVVYEREGRRVVATGLTPEP
jgi:hypothetical protein